MEATRVAVHSNGGRYVVGARADRCLHSESTRIQRFDTCSLGKSGDPPLKDMVGCAGLASHRGGVGSHEGVH